MYVDVFCEKLMFRIRIRNLLVCGPRLVSFFIVYIGTYKLPTKEKNLNDLRPTDTSTSVIKNFDHVAIMWNITEGEEDLITLLGATN